MSMDQERRLRALEDRLDRLLTQTHHPGRWEIELNGHRIASGYTLESLLEELEHLWPAYMKLRRRRGQHQRFRLVYTPGGPDLSEL